MSNSNSSKIIDVHCHLFSPGLGEKIADCVPLKSRFDIKNKVLKSYADSTPPLLTEHEQLEEAKRLGMDMVCFSTMSHFYFDRGALPIDSPHWITLAKVNNDYLHSICTEHPDRFLAFADVPMTFEDEAIGEMDRALNKLGLNGISLHSNYEGVYLDHPRFRKFFEAANRLEACIFLHPAFAFGPAYNDYHIFTLLGFPYETTLAMARLVYSGTLKQCPKIKFILSHAGGVLPFLWWRFDRNYHEKFPTCYENLDNPPTSYLNNCYFDTALTDTEALMLTHKRVGNRIIFGTDRPYHSEPSQTFDAIDGMQIDNDLKRRILGGNAIQILNNT